MPRLQMAWLTIVLASATLSAEPEKPLALTSGNNALCRIVVADRPDHLGLTYAGWRLDRTRSARHAAEVLQDYLERVTGVKIPILSASAANPGRPLILVGRSPLTEFVEADRRKLPKEGFLIRRQGRLIAIVGEVAGEDDLEEYRGADRGTLFGVYRFLEQVAGVRWYFPNELGVVVPRRPNLAVNQLDITDSPFFPMRTGAMYDRPEDAAFGDAMPVGKFGNTTGFNVNHTCYHWFKYVKEYPEVFAMGADGQRLVDASGPGGNKYNHLCYSEPKTLDLEMQQIRDFYANGTKYTEVSLLPSDKYVRCGAKDIENIWHCQCDRCRAQWTPERTQSKLSDLIFGYMGRLARQVEQEYPGKRLATFSYAGYYRPPLHVELPANLDIMICTLKGNMKLVAPGHWRDTTQVIDDWYERLGRDPARLYLFEYQVYPSNDAPMFYPHAMGRWFQFLKGKVSGGFSNGSHPYVGTARYRFTLPNAWLWHQLLWNPDADVDALLEDWYANLFGPAQGPAAQLFGEAIGRWEGAAWGDEVNPGTVSHVHDLALYRYIYPAATIDRLEQLLAAAREAAPADSVYRRRVDYFGEAFEEFFAKARAFQAADRPPPVLQPPAAPAAPVIDGNLDEPAWQEVPAFPLRERRLGTPTAVLTQLRLLHYRGALYVGADCAIPPLDKPDPEPEAARDDSGVDAGDFIEVDLAFPAVAPLDLRSFYRIRMNAAGGLADGTQLVPLVAEDAHRTLYSPFWSPPDLKTAAQRSPGRWSAELAIPLAAMPEFSAATAAIAIQFRRIRRLAPKLDLAWSPELNESYEIDLDRFGTVRLPGATTP